MEKTFIMLKPDAIERGLIGAIIRRFEEKKLRITALKMLMVTRQQAEKLYAEHLGKSFYKTLIEFITSGRVVAMVVEGDNVVKIARNLMGATNPLEAFPGTIRGDFAFHVTKNVIHGCDSIEKAKREIGIFFNEDEII